MQRFRAFMRSSYYYDELSFRRFFVASRLQLSTALQAEILALRHQLTVLQKNAPPRLRLQRSARPLWVLLSRWWPGWRWSLQIVRPDTVIHRGKTGDYKKSLRKRCRFEVFACF